MPLKLAMLGMWHVHADGIVRQVAAHPDEFSLVGFCDPDPDVVAVQSRRWRDQIPHFRVFDKPEDLLREKLDGVVVEGRILQNLELATFALEAGFPVLLEKPAGINLEEHRRFVELARRKKLHVQMIYLFRYMSAVQEMLARAKSGDLGHIYEFRGRLPKDINLYEEYARDLGVYSGGIFFEMAGHLVDMMVAILGRPRKVHPFLAHHHTAEPRSFVDHGIGFFEFDRAFGIVEVPALEIVSNTRRIEVYGTTGACIIPQLGSGHLGNNPVQPIEVFTPNSKEWQKLEPPAATLQIADLREFAAVIGGKKQPDFTMEHDLIVQEALLRASGMA